MQLNEFPATELQQKLHSREITAEALLRVYLERIDLREATVQAFAHLDREGAIAAARALDHSAVRGPLHGLPIGVKDLIDTYDLPTEYGSPIYAGHRPIADASCVALTRAAGAIVIGYFISSGSATQSASILLPPRMALGTLALAAFMCVGASVISIRKATRIDPALVFRA